MRSVLVSFGLLSVFILVSSLPLGPATLEKRQIFDPNDPFSNSLDALLSPAGTVTDTVSGFSPIPLPA